MPTVTKTLMRAWRLTMQDGTHNKYYDVYAGDDGTLVLNWGRIGTAGQTKVEKVTADDAKNMALRQVYSKASKGYQVNVDDVEFPVDENIMRNLTLYSSGIGHLQRALVLHMGSEQFMAQQRLATAHYDKFIEGAQKVLDEAANGRPLEALLDDWNSLADAWKELDDKHSHALAAVRLVQQTVQQKLMGG